MRIGDSFGLIENALRAASLRQQAIAHNLANVTTPGFHRKEVSFEALVQQAVASGADPNRVAPKLVQDDRSEEKPDGNNVNPEREMTAMAQNELWQAGLVRIMSDRFLRLRTAIGGR